MKLLLLERAPLVAAASVLTSRGDGAAALLLSPPAPRGAAGAVPLDLPRLTGEPELRFRRMDRYESLGFAAAHLALRAGARPPRGPGDPGWGIFVGSSSGCWNSNAEFFVELSRRPAAELSPALFARTISNAVNGEISITHRIGGINQTHVSGWSAGGEALIEAAVALDEGKALHALAGGVEAPGDAVRRLHRDQRVEPGMDWLPETLDEGAAMCLLTLAAPGAGSSGLRLRAFGQSHDPQGTWSLAEALRALPELSIGTVLLANSLPRPLRERWRREAGDAQVISIPDLAGEIGAAGAPAAVALAETLGSGPSRSRDGTMIVARGFEGGTVALVVAR